MTQAQLFYLQQAANCGMAAAAALLENERNKFLQAQAAWEALASAPSRASAEMRAKRAHYGRHGARRDQDQTSPSAT